MENTRVLIQSAFGNGNECACAAELMAKYAASLREIYFKSNDVGMPPYECADASDRFGDIMAFADNAFIYALKIVAEPQDEGWKMLLVTALRDCRNNMDLFAYELGKIR